MSESKTEFYGYYVCFDATGVEAVDAILEAVANACRGSHHTDGWRDKWHEDEESSEDKIQKAAAQSAEAFTRLQSALAEAERERDRLAEFAHTCPKCGVGCKYCVCHEADVFSLQQQLTAATARAEGLEKEAMRLRAGIEEVRETCVCRASSWNSEASAELTAVSRELAALLAQAEEAGDGK